MEKNPDIPEKKETQSDLVKEVAITLSAMSLAILLVVMAYETDEKKEGNNPIEAAKKVFRDERYFMLHHPDGLHDITDFIKFQEKIVLLFKNNNFSPIHFARKNEPSFEYAKAVWGLYLDEVSKAMEKSMQQGKSTKYVAETAIEKIEKFKQILSECSDGIPNE